MLQLSAGTQLMLRTYEVEDAPALFKTIDKNREQLRRWLPWVDATQSVAQSLEFIRQSKAEASQQQALALGIFYGETLIGGIGMHAWDHRLKKAEIGYWLASEYQGKGLLYQAAQAFIPFLFRQLQLNKIEIKYHPANKKSAAVAQRLHFKLEGICRDAQLVNGLFHDLVITGLLQREWVPSTIPAEGSGS